MGKIIQGYFGGNILCKADRVVISLTPLALAKCQYVEVHLLLSKLFFFRCIYLKIFHPGARLMLATHVSFLWLKYCIVYIMRNLALCPKLLTCRDFFFFFGCF